MLVGYTPPMTEGVVPPERDSLPFVLLGAAGSGTGAVRAHDPGFDETSFLAWTEEVHFAVITALNNLDAEALRQYMAESLYLRMAAQVSQSKTQGHPPAKEEPNVDHPAIVRADSNPTYDTIVVRLHPTSATADQAGPSHHGAGAVDWTFQRSSQLKTTAGPAKATTAQTCASCGAPLKLDDNGDCVYCKTPAVAKFDWVLVDMQPAAPDVASYVAAAAKAGHPMFWVIFTVVILVVTIGLPLGISLLHSGGHSSSSSSSGDSDAAASTPDTKTLTVQLTLTGAIGLSPSTLDMNDLSLNGGSFGDCPTNPLHTIGLNLTFDDGDQLLGTFTLGGTATPGTTVDLSAGGSAMLHAIGASGADVDDQTWSLKPGMTGAVTVMVDANGDGTLKWQNLPSGEPDHSEFNPLSGDATWTCS
jgi:Tim44-like domain